MLKRRKTKVKSKLFMKITIFTLRTTEKWSRELSNVM